jgi:hypothetical protein
MLLQGERGEVTASRPWKIRSPLLAERAQWAPAAG